MVVLNVLIEPVHHSFPSWIDNHPLNDLWIRTQNINYRPSDSYVVGCSCFWQNSYIACWGEGWRGHMADGVPMGLAGSSPSINWKDHFTDFFYTLSRRFFSSPRSTSRAMVRAWEYVLSYWGIINIWIFIFRPCWNQFARFFSMATMYSANRQSRKNSETYSFTVRSFCCNLINCSSISFCTIFWKNLS